MNTVITFDKPDKHVRLLNAFYCIHSASSNDSDIFVVNHEDINVTFIHNSSIGDVKIGRTNSESFYFANNLSFYEIHALHLCFVLKSFHRIKAFPKWILKTDSLEYITYAGVGKKYKKSLDLDALNYWTTFYNGCVRRMRKEKS